MSREVLGLAHFFTRRVGLKAGDPQRSHIRSLFLQKIESGLQLGEVGAGLV